MGVTVVARGSMEKGEHMNGDEHWHGHGHSRGHGHGQHIIKPAPPTPGISWFS